jgi:hypothetical protein
MHNSSDSHTDSALNCMYDRCNSSTAAYSTSYLAMQLIYDTQALLSKDTESIGDTFELVHHPFGSLSNAG